MKLKSLFLMAVAFAFFANSANAEWGTFEQKKREWAAKLNLPPIVGTWYYADMENGLETNSGLLPELAVCSLQTAVDKCVTGNGDGVALLVHTSAGSTWSFAVSKPCTLDAYGMTLYGISNGSPYFNRARIVNGSSTKTAAMKSLIVCNAFNLQLMNLHVSNGDSAGIGAVEIIKARGYMENCHLVGGVNSYTACSTNVSCLKISTASEWRFKDCIFGTNSTKRTPAADQGNIHFTGAQGQHWFENCTSLSYSNNDYHGAVFVGAATTIRGWITFKDCDFLAWYENATSGLESWVQGTAQNNRGFHIRNCGLNGFDQWDNIDSDLVYVTDYAPTDTTGYARPK